MNSFVRKMSKVKNSLVLTDYEVLLHAVTSNDEQFPSPAEIEQLVKASHVASDRQQLMQHVWEKLYGPRHKWRKVLKALIVLQQLLLHGSERVEAELREKIAKLQFLRNFRYEESGEDLGARIRLIAEEIVQRLRGVERGKEEAESSRNSTGEEERRAPARPAPFYFTPDFLVYRRAASPAPAPRPPPAFI